MLRACLFAGADKEVVTKSKEDGLGIGPGMWKWIVELRVVEIGICGSWH
jgi:hypothetical protein